MKAIILASTSPRRQQLLRQLGIEFKVVAPAVDEEHMAAEGGGDPVSLALRLAQAKALAAAEQLTAGLIIAADTIVVCEQVVMGKPGDAAEARAMLERLSGRTHEVITGLCLLERESGRLSLEYESTRVTFRALTDEDIDDYIACGESMDKAGAYGIQGYGAVLVQGIEGCFYNVMGLPLARLTLMLQPYGFESFEKPEGLK